jgi:hypothetical protein
MRSFLKTSNNALKPKSREPTDGGTDVLRYQPLGQAAACREAEGCVLSACKNVVVYVERQEYCTCVDSKGRLTRLGSHKSGVALMG